MFKALGTPTLGAKHKNNTFAELLTFLVVLEGWCLVGAGTFRFARHAWRSRGLRGRRRLHGEAQALSRLQIDLSTESG